MNIYCHVTDKSPEQVAELDPELLINLSAIRDYDVTEIAFFLS